MSQLNTTKTFQAWLTLYIKKQQALSQRLPGIMPPPDNSPDTTNRIIEELASGEQSEMLIRAASEHLVNRLGALPSPQTAACLAERWETLFQLMARQTLNRPSSG